MTEPQRPEETEESDAVLPKEGDSDVDFFREDEVIESLEEDLPSDESVVSAIRRRTAKAPVKKTEATRKRRDAQHEHIDPYKAKNPAHFVRQSVAELKQVTWPTKNTMASYFAAVLMFVLFIIVLVGLLDWAFTWSLLKLLGGN